MQELLAVTNGETTVFNTEEPIYVREVDGIPFSQLGLKSTFWHLAKKSSETRKVTETVFKFPYPFLITTSLHVWVNPKDGAIQYQVKIPETVLDNLSEEKIKEYQATLAMLVKESLSEKAIKYYENLLRLMGSEKASQLEDLCSMDPSIVFTNLLGELAGIKHTIDKKFLPLIHIIEQLALSITSDQNLSLQYIDVLIKHHMNQIIKESPGRPDIESLFETLVEFVDSPLELFVPDTTENKKLQDFLGSIPIETYQKILLLTYHIIDRNEFPRRLEQRNLEYAQMLQRIHALLTSFQLTLELSSLSPAEQQLLIQQKTREVLGPGHQGLNPTVEQTVIRQAQSYAEQYETPLQRQRSESEQMTSLALDAYKSYVELLIKQNEGLVIFTFKNGQWKSDRYLTEQDLKRLVIGDIQVGMPDVTDPSQNYGQDTLYHPSELLTFSVFLQNQKGQEQILLVQEQKIDRSHLPNKPDCTQSILQLFSSSSQHSDTTKAENHMIWNHTDEALGVLGKMILVLQQKKTPRTGINLENLLDDNDRSFLAGLISFQEYALNMLEQVVTHLNRPVVEWETSLRYDPIRHLEFNLDAAIRVFLAEQGYRASSLDTRHPNGQTKQTKRGPQNSHVYTSSGYKSILEKEQHDFFSSSSQLLQDMFTPKAKVTTSSKKPAWLQEHSYVNQASFEEYVPPSPPEGVSSFASEIISADNKGVVYLYTPPNTHIQKLILKDNNDQKVQGKLQYDPITDTYRVVLPTFELGRRFSYEYEYWPNGGTTLPIEHMPKNIEIDMKEFQNVVDIFKEAGMTRLSNQLNNVLKKYTQEPKGKPRRPDEIFSPSHITKDISRAVQNSVRYQIGDVRVEKGVPSTVKIHPDLQFLPRACFLSGNQRIPVQCRHVSGLLHFIFRRVLPPTIVSFESSVLNPHPIRLNAYSTAHGFNVLVNTENKERYHVDVTPPANILPHLLSLPWRRSHTMLRGLLGKIRRKRSISVELKQAMEVAATTSNIPIQTESSLTRYLANEAMQLLPEFTKSHLAANVADQMTNNHVIKNLEKRNSSLASKIKQNLKRALVEGQQALDTDINLKQILNSYTEQSFMQTLYSLTLFFAQLERQPSLDSLHEYIEKIQNVLTDIEAYCTSVSTVPIDQYQKVLKKVSPNQKQTLTQIWYDTKIGLRISKKLLEMSSRITPQTN